MREVSEKYFPLIEKQLSSNLTVKEFCKANGINYKALYYWKKKYLEGKKAGGPVSKTGFTALSVADVAKDGKAGLRDQQRPWRIDQRIIKLSNNYDNA